MTERNPPAGGLGVSATGDRTRVAPVGLRLQLLGGWALAGGVDHGAVPLTVRRVLAYLALRGPSSRSEIAADIWPEATESHAHGSLRTALWRARALDPGLLSCDADTAELGPGIAVDVLELVQDVRELQGGRVSDRLRLVPRSLCTGELVPGWYDEWLVLERERVRQLRLHALEGVAVALADEGAYALAMEAAVAAVRAEPLRESAHRAVMTVHLREGNCSEALRHYRAFTALLERELGVRPSPLLEDLLAAVTVTRQRRPDDGPTGGPVPGPDGRGSGTRLRTAAVP
jgi:DNA-binding SARP family transcriptional activator